MADSLKRKEFSPKKPEVPTSCKRRGEVKSEPIVLSDEYEDNIRSARRSIVFNDGIDVKSIDSSVTSGNERYDEIPTANDSNEVYNNK